MITADTTLVSIGEAARIAGVSLDRYVAVAMALGIRAADRRDGIAWLRAEDDQRVRQSIMLQPDPLTALIQTGRHVV